MPETLLPIVFTASSSSCWRRPVMKTYAPSLTNSCAVANPIPSVPPVMTAVLPSSLLSVDSGVVIGKVVRYPLAIFVGLIISCLLFGVHFEFGGEVRLLNPKVSLEQSHY